MNKEVQVRKKNRAHVHVFIYIYMYIHTRMYACVYVYMYIYIYRCIYARVTVYRQVERDMHKHIRTGQHPRIWLCIYSVCLSAYHSIYSPSIHLSIRLPIFRSIYLSTQQSIYLVSQLDICLPACLSTRLTIPPSCFVKDCECLYLSIQLCQKLVGIGCRVAVLSLASVHVIYCRMILVPQAGMVYLAVSHAAQCALDNLVCCVPCLHSRFLSLSLRLP